MDFKISRRNMIIAGGAGIVAPAIMGSSQVGTDNTTLSTTDRQISTISGSEERFGSAVEELYPGLTSDPVFQKIAPLSLLITHKNGPWLRAYSVAWALTQPNGVYRAALYFYISPGSKMKGHSLTTIRSAQQPILTVGQSRLVTPFFHWTPAQYLSIQRPDWSKLLKSIEPGTFLVSALPTATDIKTSLDGAIFADWKIMGPDRHHLGWKVRTRRNAEHDEALIVYRHLKANSPDSLINQNLQSRGFADRAIHKDFRVRWYRQARRFHAQVLWRAFNEADRDAFTKAVIRLKKQPKTIITSVNT